MNGKASVCQRMVDTVAVTDLDTYLQQSTIEYLNQPSPNEISTEGPLKQRRCVCGYIYRERMCVCVSAIERDCKVISWTHIKTV